MKKLLLTAAAVAMPLGAIAGTASVAGAAAPKTDATHASIDCTGVTGTVKFAPALTLTGGKPENSNIKLSLSGCTVTGAAGVAISAGSGAGVLHSASNSATSLLGANTVTGSVKIKWTSNVKLTNKDSTVTVTVVTGGTPTDGYASLAVISGDASVSGDFAGTDSGATSTLYTETTQSVASLTTAALGKGVKSVTLGTDGMHTTPNSLHLG